MTAFDPKSLEAEVKKYSDDIGLVMIFFRYLVCSLVALLIIVPQILKGVKDESKLLAKFAKPDRR